MIMIVCKRYLSSSPPNIAPCKHPSQAEGILSTASCSLVAASRRQRVPGPLPAASCKHLTASQHVSLSSLLESARRSEGVNLEEALAIELDHGACNAVQLREWHEFHSWWNRRNEMRSGHWASCRPPQSAPRWSISCGSEIREIRSSWNRRNAVY